MESIEQLQIGVVIATFNGEKYITQQLDSILKQSRLPNEIIISDGGSIDNTVDICRNILSEYKEIRTLILTTKKQLGVSDNFQKGLINSNADYVFLADQDDVWKPNKIETFISLMVRYDGALAFSDAEIVDNKLRVFGHSLWESVGYQQNEKVRVINACEDIYIKKLLKRNIITGMCMCLRRDLIKSVLPFDKNVLHDKWIAMYAMLEFKTVSINEKLVLYRQHDCNVVGTKTDLKRMIKNGKMYMRNVLYRKEMLENILIRSDIKNKRIRDTISDSISFHEERVNFMKRKHTLFWPIIHIEEYIENENGGLSIIVKDYLVRFLKNE